MSQSGLQSRSIRDMTSDTPRTVPATASSRTALPFGLLIVYVALIYLRPFDYAQFADAFSGVPVLPVLMSAMLISWLLSGPHDFKPAQITLMAWLFVWIPVSTMAATRWIPGTLRDISDMIPIAILFFVAATTIDSAARVRIMFGLIATACTIIAAHGIDQASQEIGWSGAIPIQGRITYVGFLNDPNDLAMALLMAIPMALSFAARAHSVLVRAAALGGTGAMLYAVYLTNSRGAILALFAMICVFAVFRFGLRRGLLVAPFLLAAAVVFAPDRLADVSADEESASGRIEAWYEGFQMLKSHPLFGVGRGEFIEHHMRTAHNSYVLAAAELGLIGFFLWFSLIVVTVQMLLTLHAHEQETGSGRESAASWREQQRLGRVLLYSTTGMLVAAFFLSRTYVVILYLLIAVVVGLYCSARKVDPSLPAVVLHGRVGRLFVIAITCVGALWLVTRILLAFN